MPRARKQEEGAASAVPVFRYVGECAAGFVTFAGVRFDQGAEVEVGNPALATKLAANSHFERVG
jgi:hypothetical protein